MSNIKADSKRLELDKVVGSISHLLSSVLRSDSKVVYNRLEPDGSRRPVEIRGFQNPDGSFWEKEQIIDWLENALSELIFNPPEGASYRTTVDKVKEVLRKARETRDSLDLIRYLHNIVLKGAGEGVPPNLPPTIRVVEKGDKPSVRVPVHMPKYLRKYKKLSYYGVSFEEIARWMYERLKEREPLKTIIDDASFLFKIDRRRAWEVWTELKKLLDEEAKRRALQEAEALFKKKESTKKFSYEFSEIAAYMNELFDKYPRELLIADAQELFSGLPADEAEYVYEEVAKFRKGLIPFRDDKTRSAGKFSDLLRFFWNNPQLSQKDAIAAAMNIFDVDQDEAENAYWASLDVPRKDPADEYFTATSSLRSLKIGSRVVLSDSDIVELTKNLSQEDLDRIFKEVARLVGPGDSKDSTREVTSRKLTPDAQEYISKKIRKLRQEGYDADQAAAIAYSMARQRGYDVPAPSKKKSALSSTAADKFFRKTVTNYLRGTGYDKVISKVSALLDCEAKMKPLEFIEAYNKLAKEFEKEGGMDLIRKVRSEIIKDRVEARSILETIKA